MCGIVGLMPKNPELRQKLGELLTPMLDCMSTRGPDSAGLAVFHEPLASGYRFALHSVEDDLVWADWFEQWKRESGQDGTLDAVGNHAVLYASTDASHLRSWICNTPVHLVSVGRAMEVFKDEGLPGEIADRYRFSELVGTHAIAHTRMATESAVSPAHAHPYTAGEDFCLVHNGSLSNPNSIRRMLEARGISFETDNDTEAGCRFLEWRMREGDTLEEAIVASFDELDGFFTFLMGTADKMVLVRDAFTCKPAIAAETDEYVAVASEFRSLAHLPGIQSAHVFEPMPEQIYSWSV